MSNIIRIRRKEHERMLKWEQEVSGRLDRLHAALEYTFNEAPSDMVLAARSWRAVAQVADEVQRYLAARCNSDI